MNIINHREKKEEELKELLDKQLVLLNNEKMKYMGIIN